MQVKTMTKCYLAHTRMTRIKKMMTVVVKDVEELKCSYTAGENGKWYNHFGNSLAVY